MQIQKSLFRGITVAAGAMVLSFGLFNAFEARATYSCTVTTDCNGTGNGSGSVSCTGTQSCSRGFDWVKCDGKQTNC